MSDIHASQVAYGRSRQVVGNGVASGMRAAMKPQPLFMKSGSGAHVTDVDGNEYIDYVLGFGPVLIGHSHPRVVEAVTQQLSLGQLFGACSTLEYEVAERVLSILPVFDRVLYSNTGTEAIQSAVRLARAATGRRKIVKFAAGYHGWHDTVYISFVDVGDERTPLLNSRGQNPSVLQDIIVLPYNDAELVRSVLLEHKDDIAAVILEATLTSGGVFEASREFLQTIRTTCDETGALMILDEVVTGFRMALGGAVEHFGVVPDLAVYAKALASGFSLSLIAGRSAVVDLVEDGVVHAGTYNGNPIALAAAKATLEVLSEPGTHQHLAAQCTRLADGISSALSASGIAGRVNHMPGVVQVLPGATSRTTPGGYNSLDWKIWDDWSTELVGRGLHLLPKGRMFVSTAHTEDDIEFTVDAFRSVLARG